MYKKLNDLKKQKINKLKAVDPQTNENKVLKPNVLDNIGDLFNELYYICKDKHNEEKDDLNTKDKKPLYYKKLRLTNDYHTSLKKKKRKKKNNRLVKCLIKKNHLKNQQKMIGLNLTNGLMKKKKT